MPEISRFYGIIIRMFYADHHPPHFHAYYQDHKVIINIQTLSILEGNFPPRALGLVMEWAAFHQNDLKEFWNKAQNMEELGKIEPLR